MFIYHLNNSEVFLPPQILLDLWAERCQAVVAVHQHMNACVNCSSKESCEEENKFITSKILITFQDYDTIRSWCIFGDNETLSWIMNKI